MDLDIVEKPEDAFDLADGVENDPELNGLPDLRAMVLATPELRRFYLASTIRCLDATRAFFEFGTKRITFVPDPRTRLRAATFLAALAGDLPEALRAFPAGIVHSPGLSFEEALEASAGLRSRVRELLVAAEPRRRRQGGRLGDSP